MFRLKMTAISRERCVLLIIACLAVAYSLYLAVAYASQPPLDVYSFRQTQTALTSYWFVKEGFQFSYETPVAGTPWAIPFEFPIYQTIVAYISKTFDFGLDSTGRLVSYSFLLLTIVPVIGITKRLRLPRVTSVYFAAILFSMPIYVYWGRSFMIETAAFFFSIAAIKFFLDFLLVERILWPALLFVIFATLCVLQKATTALPIFVVLSIVYFVVELKKNKSQGRMQLIKGLAIGGIVFVIPVAIGFAWVNFSDQVKLTNPLGEQLTSAALKAWNWGTLSQRLSSEIWIKVIWERVLRPNMGGLLGLFLLASPFFVKVESKIKIIALGALTLAILPLFLFTNLHIVHSYYQTANALFFAYGVAITLAAVAEPMMGKRIALFALVLVMASNYFVLRNVDLPQIKNVFTKENRDLAIGKLLNRELPVGMQFVAFGNDWSSTFAYVSERKSFTVPGWFKKIDQVISHPDQFLEQGRMGAVVSCTNQQPTVTQVFKWVENNGAWKVGETHGCLIVTPEKKFSGVLSGSAQCRGSIDIADIRQSEGKQFIAISGWLVGEDDSRTPDDVIVKVSNKHMAPIYLQTLKVPRLDVNKNLKIPEDIDVGFSRIVQNKFKPGSYEVKLLEAVGNKLVSCGIRKSIEVR